MDDLKLGKSPHKACSKHFYNVSNIWYTCDSIVFLVLVSWSLMSNVGRMSVTRVSQRTTNTSKICTPAVAILQKNLPPLSDQWPIHNFKISQSAEF